MHAKTPPPQKSTPTLITIPVAVDLIRFEKNLLQMGFFGAHDTRHTTHSSRRIEQWVTREGGQRIKVAAEFRASQEFGLPSTSDRDKYIAFMRIAMRQKAKLGSLQNPIRFTGYQLLKELGLSYSGENYEDINRWGQRMADTTITSEQVIYLAARKKYANRTVHVFRSFTRAGQSHLDDTGKTEAFEVVLEDWLLENLNHSYVIPEDFNAYRRLKRPTGKGVFGYLHLWFHASRGRVVEKDYSELCMLLNIPAYKHISKIRETMGKSLDELSSIGYLSKWDIRPMVTKTGYKLLLEPGEEVLRVLAISQRKELNDQPEKSETFTPAQQHALQALADRGVSPIKATSIVQRHKAETIMDQIEYAEFLVTRGKRNKIQNPAGFIIYIIENEIPVPTDFDTSRRLREKQERAAAENESNLRRQRLELQYDEFVNDEVERAISTRYPAEELTKKLREIIKQQRRVDDRFDLLTSTQQCAMAKQFLREEVKDNLEVPTLEAWVKTQEQIQLFKEQSGN
jgi:hypothetical protein